jgi:hypothetical protein
MMGGPRSFARGIDESANAANCVETEQLMISSKSPGKLSIYSYIQIRGSVPLFWSLEGGKAKLDRSLESSRD